MDLITVDEAATLAGCKKRTIYRWIATGLLDKYERQPRGTFVSKAQVIKLITPEKK